MARSTIVLAALSCAASVHCGGCDDPAGLSDEGVRVWGRQKIAEAVKARARVPIDTYKLDVDAGERQRALTMPFDELVERFGFLRLEARARFLLTRNGHEISIEERTTVEHGLHGSFRVVQKDEDDAVMREFVFNNEVLYIRNGNRGKMRVQGIIDNRHLELREEAWAPLKTYASFYGERFGLKQVGPARVGKRTAVRYRLRLLDGPERIAVPGVRGERQPIALSGDLYVDEKTGVPTRVKLRGELRVPSAEGTEPGVLKIFLNSIIESVPDEEAKELKPESYVPTIAHRPVDLDPLRFLEEDTRTSTVISGAP